MLLCARNKTYLVMCMALLVSQCDACLDLLVRSLNEIFSPIIEVGDDRREQSHDVDELTHLYERDQYGNLVLNREERHSSHPSARSYPKRRRTKNDQVESIFNQLARSRSDDETVSQSEDDALNGTMNAKNAIDDGIGCSVNQTDEPLRNLVIKIDKDMLDEDEYEDDEYDNYEDEYYHPRSTSYVPGRRPLVDFIIKLIEMFQLTAQADFITSRPKYTRNQFLPETDDNYK